MVLARVFVTSIQPERGKSDAAGAKTAFRLNKPGCRISHKQNVTFVLKYFLCFYGDLLNRLTNNM